MFKHSYQNLNHCRCQKPTETGLVSYGETIYDTFPTISAIKRRLAYMVRTFPGTMWHDPGHARRMNSVHCLTGYNPARNTKDEHLAVVPVFPVGNCPWPQSILWIGLRHF